MRRLISSLGGGVRLLQLAAFALALAVPGLAAAEQTGGEGSPLFQQRLVEMGQQFDGTATGDARERQQIGGEHAFVFPSEAVSACVGSACSGSGCIGSVCTGSGCGGSVCVGSGCAGKCGQESNLTDDGLPSQLAARFQSDVVQEACALPVAEAPTAVRVGGFEVARTDGRTEISWILTGGSVETYRVVREVDGVAGVVGFGKASLNRMQQVTVDAAEAGARYSVEVTDSAGWTTTVTSDGTTTREPSRAPTRGQLPWNQASLF